MPDLAAENARALVEAIREAAGDYRSWALQARQKYISLRLRQDPEIRGLYIRAADRVAAELRRLGAATPSNQLRRRHLEQMEQHLRAEADRFVDDLMGKLKDYIEQAVDAGAGYSRRVTLELLKRGNWKPGGVSGMFAQVNRQAVEACWVRTRDGLRLSDRIWQKGDQLRQTMRDLIQESVAIGQDAVKTAQMLEQYVRTGAKTLARQYPKMMDRMAGRIPGDISYEALRLVRTETTAAFGEGTIAAAQASPSYKGIRWVLSKAHPLPDICDDLAAHDEGLGEGVYAPSNEPPYPAHPNCLCHLVPVHDQPEEFVERLKRWRDNPESEPALEKWYNQVGNPGGRHSQGSGPLLTPTPKRSSFAEILEEKEREIAGRATEKCYAFDSQGKIILSKEGTQNQISFDDDELKKLSGLVFTHNHPRGTSFSLEDIALASTWNLKEIRAVSTNYRYSMKPPKGGWSKELWQQEIAPLAASIYQEVYSEFLLAIQIGKMTPAQASQLHMHEVWTRVAKVTGLRYIRKGW